MVAEESVGLYALYRQQAERLGDAVAVQGLNAADLTYRGLIVQIERIIAALAGWGIGPGDRVLVQLPNGPEAFVTLQGVAASAVVMLVNLKAGATEVDYFLRFVEPKAIILQQGVDCSGRALAQRHGVRVIEIIPTPEMGAGTFVFAEPPPPLTVAPTLNSPDELAFLMSTSGTTALPKLIPLTQRTMLIEGVASITLLRDVSIQESSPMRVLSYLPMHIYYGAVLASTGPATGGRVACMPGLDMQEFYHWLDRYRPTFLSGPSAIFEQILAMAPAYPDVLARHSVRFINVGGSPLSAVNRERLDQTFGVPIIKVYAMTEVGIIAHTLLIPFTGDPGRAVGRAVDPAHTRIMAPDGSFLPEGEMGGIVVKPDIFTGYWNNPAANAEAFVDGWFRTGDEGSMDADGNLFIVGRVKEVINSGGAKVSPTEVETVLKQHPQVTDAVVFGIKHVELGETVAAVIVGAVSERELRKFAAERLPFYKVPMRILIVEAIPTAPSGKVQRNRLAELLGLA